MGPIVYGDFTCAVCYLGSWRADLMSAAQGPIDWRAVEYHPKTSFTGSRLNQQEREQMNQSWSSARDLLLPGEDLPGQPPTFLANTRAAVAGYAEAHGAGVAERVRRLLFHAYWVDGQDIGNPEVLRVLLAEAIRSGSSTSQPLHEFGYAVTLARGPVTSIAYHLILDWRKQWQDLGQPCDLLFQDSAGEALTGQNALSALGELMVAQVSERHELASPMKHQWSGRYWV